MAVEDMAVFDVDPGLQSAQGKGSQEKRDRHDFLMTRFSCDSLPPPPPPWPKKVNLLFLRDVNIWETLVWVRGGFCRRF